MFTANSFKLESYVDKALKDIERGQKAKRMKAVNYFKSQLKTTIKQRNLVGKGNLLKGVKSDDYRYTSLIGMAPPAFHALIVQYGSFKTPDRIKKKSGQSTGAMPANPYFTDTLNQSIPEMQKIMSEEW